MGCGVLRTGGQQVSEKRFGWEDSVGTQEAEKPPQSAGSVRRDFMPMEKPNQNRVGIVLVLVDRSGEWLKLALFIACQQGSEVMPGTRRASEVVPWEPNPAEAAEGERRFYVRREVELAKCGFSDDCEGCRVAQSGADAKPHSEGCRERIRQAMMSDDVGQQRLHGAEQRCGPAGGPQALATRVEVVHEGQNEVTNQAPQDLIGELLRSLYGTRKVAHNWEKKRQKFFVDNNFKISTWSPAVVCCRERELCGFVHGDDFIFTAGSVQLA